ncbi:hypothetical protein YB2330_002410 [Saitoella coloradoensis]
MPGSSYGFNPPQSLHAPINPPPLNTTGRPNPFQTQSPLHTYAQNPGHQHQHHQGHRPHPGPIQLPPPMPLQLPPYPLPTTGTTNNGGNAAAAQVGQAFNQLGPGSREGTSTATRSREYSRSVTSTPSPPPVTSAPRGVGVSEGRETYAAGMHGGYGHSRSTSGSLSLTSAASPDYPPIPLSHTSSHSHSYSGSGSQTPTPSLQKHPSNTKRAAQNRAAQKAFRVRREKYVRDLESKASEFEALKERVRELEEENRRLRGGNR